MTIYVNQSLQRIEADKHAVDIVCKFLNSNGSRRYNSGVGFEQCILRLPGTLCQQQMFIQKSL